MPGTNAGTGHPLTLRCAKCRLGRDWRRHSDRGTRLEATGKWKRICALEYPIAHLRLTWRRIQYRCLDCGHIGWTRHVDAEGLLGRHA